MLRWLGGWPRQAALVAMLGACSGIDVAPAAAPSDDASDAEQLAQVLSDVGEACPGMAAGEPTLGGKDQIFVEAAIVDVPSSLAEQASVHQLVELGRSRDVKLVATPHVIGSYDAETDMGLGQTADSRTPVALSRWKVRPSHVDDKTSILELELELSTREPPSNVALNKAFRFSVTTRDNEPSLAHLGRDDAGSRSLLVAFRTFRIHGEAELRAIFECKMRHRAQYLRRRAPTH